MEDSDLTVAGSSFATKPAAKNARLPLQNNLKKRFNFNDYLQSTLKLQDKYDGKTNSIKSSKWNFKNSCKVIIDKSINVTSKQIIDSLRASFQSTTYQSIESVGQYSSSKCWIIKFNTDIGFQNSLDKDISINGHSIKLTDANAQAKPLPHKEYKLTAFLRFHWLPMDFSEYDIEEFLFQETNGLDILDIYKESSPHDNNIKNGIFVVKCQYLPSEHQQVLDLIGLHRDRVEDKKTGNFFSAMIYLSGHAGRCLGCQELGHLKKNCPKKELTCVDCNRIGHAKCTMAEMLKRSKISNEHEENDDDDENIEIDLAPPNSFEAVCLRVLASEEGDYCLTKKQAEFQMPIIPISNDSVETKIETTPIFNSNTFNKKRLQLWQIKRYLHCKIRKKGNQ